MARTLTRKPAKKPLTQASKAARDKAPKKAASKKVVVKKAVPSNGAGAALTPEQVAGEVVALDPAEIVSQDRVRQDLGDINELASSISKYGQIQPITVFNQGGKVILEAGERRRQACAQLKRPVLAVFVDPASERHRLKRQLHENFRRKDFDPLEASEGLQRDKRLYEAEHPETKRGAVGHKGAGSKTKAGFAESAKPAPRFTLSVSKEMGVSERKVQELLSIANLPREYKKRIEAATTTAERNKVAQECIQEVRQRRKQEALKKEAETRRQMTVEEVTEDKPKITLHFGTNEDFMKGEEHYDVILTDPPYDRERSIVSHAARASINPKEHAWDKLDVGWVLRAAPTLKKGGHLIVFCPIEAVGAYELAIQAAGLEYRQAMIWVKSNPAPVHRDCYASAVEAIVWATKPGAKAWFNPTAAKAGASSWNVFQGPGVPGSAATRLHPTQKPDWLIEKLLRNHAGIELGHTVLDPFAGSGTTGVVAQKLGLACTLIEVDEDYVKAIKLRLGAGK